MSSEAPWGFLLPLRDGPPPLELTFDSATVGTSDNCTLQVDGALLGLPAGAAPQILFKVLQEKSSGNVLLRCESNVVWLNGNQLSHEREEDLEHGARIAFSAEEATYVFVNREKSDSFTAPPDVLVKYLVGHCLGRGGFGNVYLLFHKKLNYQRSAMKIVEPGNEEEFQSAEREGRILKTLNHPCVINIFSVKELGPKRCLIMEYMAGGDLRQFVNNERPLSENQTKLIFFQLALALQYLHERKICHRDLKPANVLLQHRNPHTLIKVTDFGLAKDENDDSSLMTIAGSKRYMAPEIFSHKSPYTNSVDVWSMGVILFYSLTGSLPFRNFYEGLRNGYVVQYDPEEWEGVSLHAQTLVKSMLKVEAHDRVSVPQILEDPWLHDDAMRQDVCKLSDQLNHFALRGLNVKFPPWGYLLPLRDGPPPLELREDHVTVGTDKNCTLYVDSTTLLLPWDTPPEILFVVRRDRSTGKVLLRSDADVVLLNSKILKRGMEECLEHGAQVAFNVEEATYVFVNREDNNSSRIKSDVLEEYLVGHKLGTFGNVFLVFDIKLNYQRMVMKIIESKDEQSRQLTGREASIVMSLKYPCVIETFNIKEFGPQTFVFMEHVAGGDLSQFVNHERLLSEKQTKLLFFQLALAVQYLHERKICHLNLKPTSVLLQYRNPHTLIKVTNFRLAKDENDHLSLQSFSGTHHYLAPEIIHEEKCTNAVDVWSTGVMLFFCLTGSLPFNNLDNALHFHHVVKYIPNIWWGMSLQAQMLVRDMLKVKADDRLSMSQIVEDPWFRDEDMRESVFQLTGLQNYRFISPSPSEELPPWGYLLPLRDGCPPLELKGDSATVGTASNCTLQVDSQKIGLPAHYDRAAPQVLFTLARARSTTSALLSVETDVMLVRLGSRYLQRGFVETLERPSPISFGSGEAAYVFVNGKDSDLFDAPSDIQQDFLVGHCIRSGFFGKIYIVFDKNLNYKRKALKIVVSKVPEEMQYAERESNILRHLSHPCIIKIFSYECYKNNMKQFLVMEYMGGGDLRQFVNDRRPLSEVQTKLLFFQLALAVQYLHDKRIYHRNLKPCNVLLKQHHPHTLIKLSEFYLANDEYYDSSLMKEFSAGPFMAPEIVENNKYTSAADVWSLGAILFYSLTGEHPLGDLRSPGRRLIKYYEDTWQGVSLQAQQLVRNMLNEIPADRVSVSQVIEDSWLRDNKMRKDVLRLTGLQDFKLQHAESPKDTALVPAKKSTASLRRSTTSIAGTDNTHTEVNNKVNIDGKQQSRKLKCTLS